MKDVAHAYSVRQRGVGNKWHVLPSLCGNVITDVALLSMDVTAPMQLILPGKSLARPETGLGFSAKAAYVGSTETARPVSPWAKPREVKDNSTRDNRAIMSPS
jgi:hypothetical protein